MAEVARIRRKQKRPVSNIPPVKPKYDVPKWAGNPPPGMHLDVTKEGKLIEKFIVDGKTHYFFGRQKEFIDFTIDHTSCSRVHAVMVYHKPLQRMFLLDLGSTHGTFMGSIRLEKDCPKQLPVDETFHFGASTRTWTLREKLNTIPNPGLDSSLLNSSVTTEGNELDKSNISLLGLPEAENDLNDLTEYNTALNRRVTNLPIDEPVSKQRKRKKSNTNVSFNDEEEVINPEDIDPTVGRFRNLVSTEIVTQQNMSVKQPKELTDTAPKVHQDFQQNNLYTDIADPSSQTAIILPKITSAPDVESPDLLRMQPVIKKVPAFSETAEEPSFEPVRKKYMKEAWPGRKPKGQNLLSV